MLLKGTQLYLFRVCSPHLEKNLELFAKGDQDLAHDKGDGSFSSHALDTDPDMERFGSLVSQMKLLRGEVLLDVTP